MNRVDEWETVASFAMYILQHNPQFGGSYSVASALVRINRLATTLHRLETERANGLTETDKTINKRKTEKTENSLARIAASLKCNMLVEGMGYVAFYAGPVPTPTARRLGVFPMKR